MNRVADRRPLRADAARNVDKIITAARQCFREHGPEVPLQTIAVTAGVGPATLFRNFADKEELVLAALHRQLGLLVDPVIEEALAGPDAADGLFRVIDARWVWPAKKPTCWEPSPAGADCSPASPAT